MYKIPSYKELEKAILESLEEHKEVKSQRLFRSLLLKKIKAKDKKYLLSEERLRKVASRMKAVGIFVEKRKSNREIKKCWICGMEMTQIKVRDLFGTDTAGGKKCTSCGFKIDKINLAPLRYVFYKK